MMQKIVKVQVALSAINQCDAMMQTSLQHRLEQELLNEKFQLNIDTIKWDENGNNIESSQKPCYAKCKQSRRQTGTTTKILNLTPTLEFEAEMKDYLAPQGYQLFRGYYAKDVKQGYRVKVKASEIVFNRKTIQNHLDTAIMELKGDQGATGQKCEISEGATGQKSGDQILCFKQETQTEEKTGCQTEQEEKTDDIAELEQEQIQEPQNEQAAKIEELLKNQKQSSQMLENTKFRLNNRMKWDAKGRNSKSVKANNRRCKKAKTFQKCEKGTAGMIIDVVPVSEKGNTAELEFWVEMDEYVNQQKVDKMKKYRVCLKATDITMRKERDEFKLNEQMQDHKKLNQIANLESFEDSASEQSLNPADIEQWQEGDSEHELQSQSQDSWDCSSSESIKDEEIVTYNPDDSIEEEDQTNWESSDSDEAEVVAGGNVTNEQ